MGSVIEMRGVVKRFAQGTFTLSLPELNVQEGMVTGFIGANGAGKTTTIKLLLGLLRPSEGELRIFGQAVNPRNAALRAQVGYVGESNGYMSYAQLGEIAQMLRPFYKTWDDALFKQYTERFELDIRSKYKSLSSGQKKKFALLMALVTHPRLLILDEATANLDPLVRDEILGLLMEKMEQEGVSIFFSTHITSDLDKIADELVLLHRGKLLLRGDKDTLLEGHRVVKGSCKLLRPEIEQVFVHCEQGEFGFYGLTNQPDEAGVLFGREAVFERATVEDIFLGYTKREGRAL